MSINNILLEFNVILRSNILKNRSPSEGSSSVSHLIFKAQKSGYFILCDLLTFMMKDYYLIGTRFDQQDGTALRSVHMYRNSARH